MPFEHNILLRLPKKFVNSFKQSLSPASAGVFLFTKNSEFIAQQNPRLIHTPQYCQIIPFKNIVDFLFIF